MCILLAYTGVIIHIYKCNVLEQRIAELYMHCRALNEVNGGLRLAPARAYAGVWL